MRKGTEGRQWRRALSTIAQGEGPQAAGIGGGPAQAHAVQLLNVVCRGLVAALTL
jgi:hypothetical protein